MGSNLLTHSRMDSLKRCRKRCWWEYEIGLRPTTDAKALRMGSAYHIGLDALKVHGYSAKDEAAAAVRNYYSAIHTESEDQANAMDFECETVVAMVIGYAWRWGNSELEVIESEMSFELPVVNPITQSPARIFKLAGKIDGIVRLEDGRLAVLEHKLQSDKITPDSDYWPRLEMDAQISLYVYAARQMGYDVATALYDVAKKPTIRPSQMPLVDEDGYKIVLDANGNRVMTKDGKKPRQTGDTKSGYVLQTRDMTTAEWVDKLTEDIGNFPETYYARQEIPRLDADIYEHMSEVWDIQNVLREAQRNNRWYKTVHRDTCSFCPYFGLCTSKYDPSGNVPPDGFAFIENVHPELGEE